MEINCLDDNINPVQGISENRKLYIEQHFLDVIKCRFVTGILNDVQFLYLLHGKRLSEVETEYYNSLKQAVSTI